MTKRYFIYAYDELYGGLYGIHDCYFFEGTFKEACDIGMDMAYDIIQSYSFIEEQLFEGTETDEEREEIIQNDMMYEIYELRDDAPSFDALYNLNYSPDAYIDEFCKV